MNNLRKKIIFLLASDSDTSTESISRMQQKFGVALLLHGLASQVYQKTRTVLRYESSCTEICRGIVCYRAQMS
jgi:hypothetical protein